jgi:hypothetical protein
MYSNYSKIDRMKSKVFFYAKTIYANEQCKRRRHQVSWEPKDFHSIFSETIVLRVASRSAESVIEHLPTIVVIRIQQKSRGDELLLRLWQ